MHQEEESRIHAAGAPVVGRAHRRRLPRHWAMNIIGIGAVLALCYYGELVLAIMLVSVLLAFILAPLVDLLMILKLPRGVAAFVSVGLLLFVTYLTVYFSYNQADSFLQDLPKYTASIRREMMSFRQKAERLDVLSAEDDKGVVQVRPAHDFTETLTRGFGSVSELILALTFVPFLVYFMLTWQHHVRSATVMLFPLENRHTAYVTLGLISGMIRSFMVGNLLIGLFLSGISTLVFWALGVPFFYFVGVFSGFLSLVPYLGLPLAMAPPLFVGIGQMSSSNIFMIAIVVFMLHLIELNVLYPKFLGNRLQLNPLAVTMSLLFWGWLWGAVGLVLAIPITAASKIVFDHVDNLKPIAAWLGE